MSAIPHNPCATCGACCRSYLVPLCGYDVWRICTRQRLAPEQFTLVYAQKDLTPDGFYLEADGPSQALALDKQGTLRPKQPCVFLVKLAGGHDRCGVYADRPVVCQSYPMAFAGQTVMQRDDVLCPPNSWPPSALVRPAWRESLLRLRMQFDVYHEVVARWNARVAATPGRRFALAEYFSYLLNVYDRLDRLGHQIGDEGMALVQATWRDLPEPDTDGVRRIRVGELAWLNYFEQAREVIDRFYPEVTPLPLRLPRAAPEPPVQSAPGQSSSSGGKVARPSGDVIGQVSAAPG